MATSVEITFDANDPSSLADFWAAALGHAHQPSPGYESWDDWAMEKDKIAKNRVHRGLQIGGGSDVPLDNRKDRINAEADRIEALGATRLGPVEERGSFHIVMQNPEGNEFCVD